ncbi:bifunctional folylpolyglutamate synthase/dihydrofolate synthase [Mangrovivirga sp. M17]|uniref:Dihydrofolate synthase/folylpolyglutamate synthase n=1 Tax=Mangrovivirga halotolerans TaxID=2993936 RepID=A0ABT3RWF5_9BACT|nr:folylpolyglutamate synthase/dihydrofolate synthase family protein [Mangrovivirga halotolerans]MCX2746099.1 bifunctional folylpolyglutamate synthase/dihydrofolate synthase [Mangrovivirga halotolerans]
MTYEQIEEYLFEQLPMYQRMGTVAFKTGLGNIQEFCKILGDPQDQFKTVHIAGTNGKGSSSHMIASVLQENGYKTGLYTSPHLKSFRERVKINGLLISRQYIIDFVEKYKTQVEHLKPSFFEWTVGLAFKYFADQKVDIAVIEVGLGGRLDSTNIITPLVSLITNIGLDHKEMLGNTLQQIAGEKAGIIKPGIDVVISETQPEIADVFKAKANENKSNIIFAADKFTLTDLKKYSLDLKGEYQLRNLPGVLAVIDELKEKGFVLPKINEGLSKVVSNTGLQGRWQILSEKPFVVCDTAHNVEGLRETIQQFLARKAKRYRFVMGFVSDKAVEEVLELVPKNAVYYFCTPNVPRGLKVADLKPRVTPDIVVNGYYDSVNEAVIDARKDLEESDALYIGGSTFVVAELNELDYEK